MPECTALDHSEYKVGTNWYGFERAYPERRQCAKCSRHVFNRWLMDDSINKIEWARTGADYWRAVFKRAKTECYWVSKVRGQKYTYGNLDGDEYTEKDFAYVVEDPIKAIRLRRYDIRLPRKRERRPVVDYGFVRGALLQRHVDRMIQELDEPCLDNVRFAAVSNRREMRRYRWQQSKGCCGSHDEEVSICGKKFMIGCNYGH